MTNMPTDLGAASAGLAYELVDAQNYYDIALGDNGTRILYQTLAGVRTVVASAPWQGGQSRSLQLGVVRFQNKTSIEVDGQRIFNEVPQARSRLTGGDRAVTILLVLQLRQSVLQLLR